MARVHVHTMREPGNHDLDRKETIRCISKAVKENVRYVPSHIPDTKMTLSSTAKSTIVRNRSNLTDQVIGIDGNASQFVITIHFTPNSPSNQKLSLTESPDEKLLLKVNDAAERLSLSRTNFYKLLMNGELESIKIGRSRLIPTDALESFVNQHRYLTE